MALFQEFDDYTEMAGSLGVRVSGNGGWQRVDVTAGVRHWAAEGAPGPLLLLLDCSGCGEAVRLPLPLPRGAHPSHPARPFLVLRAAPPTARRVRRRALDCGPDARNQCCKQRFYVSFRALGWDDWIIAPHGYFANYCRGDCGTNRTPDTFLTYYSHVLDEYRRLDRLAGLRPCCAPLKFSSMSLIYFGPDSNIIKRDLPKMVVDECGCPWAPLLFCIVVSETLEVTVDGGRRTWVDCYVWTLTCWTVPVVVLVVEGAKRYHYWSAVSSALFKLRCMKIWGIL